MLKDKQANWINAPDTSGIDKLSNPLAVGMKGLFSTIVMEKCTVSLLHMNIFK